MRTLADMTPSEKRVYMQGLMAWLMEITPPDAVPVIIMLGRSDTPAAGLAEWVAGGGVEVPEMLRQLADDVERRLEAN